jgi:hypothetical protein
MKPAAKTSALQRVSGLSQAQEPATAGREFYVAFLSNPDGPTETLQRKYWQRNHVALQPNERPDNFSHKISILLLYYVLCAGLAGAMPARKHAKTVHPDRDAFRR